MKPLSNLLNEENGQGLVEYLLIAVLISIVTILTLSKIGFRVDVLFGDVPDAFK